ncbi:MAG: stage V sporulation protein AD, partial [Clostridia bacterium]|nr:stage V sporulation protein AD [Clostridia bacterium]
LGKNGEYLSSIHKDAGLLLYDTSDDDFKIGGSGCGCSASVLSSFILPEIEEGRIEKIALLSTGALMSTGSVGQGDHILGVAPLIVIERNKS